MPRNKKNKKVKQNKPQPRRVIVRPTRKIVVQRQPVPAEPKSSGGIFQNIGSSLGGAAGKWLGSLFGMGAYQLQKNSLMADPGPGQFRASSDGSVVVAHREFLTDVTGSTNFTLNSYDLNPGLSTSFPWLAQLAANFEQFEFRGLVYEFKSTSAVSVASTNTALGTVIMATEYDSLKPDFTTKQQMEAYQFCTSANPSCSFYHPVECAPRQNVLQNLYTRSGSLPSGADERFYDLGVFQIATVGMQAAATIGELWVSYEVKLLKPRLPTPLGAEQPVALYRGDTATGTTFANMLSLGGSIPLTFITTNNVRIPYPGTYLVTVTLTATTSVTMSPATITANGTAVVLTNFWKYSGGLAQSSAAGSGQANFTCLFVITINNGSTDSFSITAPSVVGTGTAQLTVSTWNPLIRLTSETPSHKKWIEVDVKESDC